MLKMSVNVILMEFLFGYDNINVITYEQSAPSKVQSGRLFQRVVWGMPSCMQVREILGLRFIFL